jgi:hypothetical protein
VPITDEVPLQITFKIGDRDLRPPEIRDVTPEPEFLPKRDADSS